MRELPDKCVDLVLTDPPYGIGEDGSRNNGRVYNKNGKPIRRDKRNGAYITTRPKNYPKAVEVLPSQEVFDEIFRIGKNHIIFGSNYFHFNQKKESSGRIFWDKVNGASDQSDGELAWTNLFDSVRQIEFMWSGFLQGKSISEGRTNQGNKSLCENRVYPTQKPLLLLQHLLKKHASSGNIVMDPYGGSGTTGVACLKENRDFIIFEIVPESVEIANKRIEAERAQLKMF
jgi:site-specific DNA-methyltransferase (adenine-specific)